MPVGAVLIGGIALVVVWRRNRGRAKAAAAGEALTPAEEARLARLLHRSDL